MISNIRKGACVTEVNEQGRVKEGQVVVVAPPEPNFDPNYLFSYSGLGWKCPPSQGMLGYLIGVWAVAKNSWAADAWERRNIQRPKGGYRTVFLQF